MTPIATLMAAIANAAGQQAELGQADDRGERGCDHAKHEPAARGGPRACTSKVPANDPTTKNRIASAESEAGPNSALRGLIAGLGGVPAHERHEDAIGDHAVGVDEAGDHGESSGQELCVSSLGARRAVGDRASRAEWPVANARLCEVIGHDRTFKLLARSRKSAG